MMLVHETGHVASAVASGGVVAKMELPLVGFSRTEVSPDPHPLLVAAMGPVVGALLPAAAVLMLRLFRRRIYLAEVFAAFCMLANLAYVSFGCLDRAGDAGDLMKYGAPQWVLWMAGLLAIGAGLMQMHLLGPRLGIKRVTALDMWLAGGLVAVLVAMSACLSFRD